MHGTRGAEVEAAYRTWRRDPSLERFVAYLEIGSASHLAMVRRRVRETGPLMADGRVARVLETLLARLAGSGARVLVLLMPENPILALDRAGEYHRPGFSEEAATFLARAAARHGLPMVDARGWMAAEHFIDFDHLMPDLGDFQTPLAAEMVHALGA
jgi:hypothetical protein